MENILGSLFFLVVFIVATSGFWANVLGFFNELYKELNK